MIPRLLTPLLTELLILGLVANSLASSPNLYHVTDLGTLGGSSSSASAINSSGQVAGSADLVDGTTHAYRYSAGTLHDLGTLGGASSFGQGINDQGNVVGTSYVLPGDPYIYHAFVYSGIAMADLGAAGGDYSTGTAINNSGQVVGDSPVSAAGLADHAVLYNGRAFADLGSLPGGDINESIALAINSSGVAVGQANTNGQLFHAVRFSAAGNVDLGTLGGDGSAAEGINDLGQIVGFADTDVSGSNRAFLYSGGAMDNLGTLGGSFVYSDAAGINNHGQVVGSSASDMLTISHAFLYEGATMFDLNAQVDASGSGWTLQHANAINDSGWIVGTGINPQGLTHAFLLTPVPEPSNILLAAVGILGSVVGVRRRAPSRSRLIVGMNATIALSIYLAVPPALASTVRTSDGNGADTELRESSGITRGGATDLNTRSEPTPSNMELIALRFDVSGINPALIDHAQLQTIVDRTGMPANNGLDVYGLNVDTLGQNWTENTSNGVWNAANPFPGLTYDGVAATFPINPAETTFLGSTTWSAAPAQGSLITFDVPKLTTFLRSSGPLATLFLFRDAPTGTQIRLASKETVSLGQTGTGPPVGTGEFAPRLSFDVLPSNSLVVHYTQTGSVDFGLNADSVKLSGISGNLTLPPDAPILAEITNVEFNVQFGEDGFQTFDISRDLVLNGVHGTLTQSAQLSIGANGDVLSIFNGDHTTFDLGSVGSVEVWPQGGDFGRNDLTGPGPITGTLLTQLIYHPAAVPEPATLWMLLAIAPTICWRRSKVSHTRPPIPRTE